MPKPKKLNPVVALDEPKSIQFKTAGKEPTDLVTFLDGLKAEVQADVADRNTSIRKDLWNYQWRRCQVGKKDKNLPFPNSSDLRYPIIESEIRKKKPGDVSVVWNAPQIVRYSPGGVGSNQDAKDRLELFNNYLYRTHVPRFLETLTSTSDKKYESGKVFVKVTWSHKTEWRTKVFLKEDGDKLKAFVQTGKLKAIQEALQQRVAQQQQQTTQQGNPQDPSQPTTPYTA